MKSYLLTQRSKCSLSKTRTSQVPYQSSTQFCSCFNNLPWSTVLNEPALWFYTVRIYTEVRLVSVLW